MSREPSRRADLPVHRRIAENVRLLHATVKRGPRHYEWVFDELESYDELLRRYSGISLRDARTFEVGFGARPYRVRSLRSAGVDAHGVDVEVPVVQGRPREFARMARENGVERAAKSVVRHVLLDRREERAFANAARERGYDPAPIEPERLLVGDAATCDAPGPFDLVYSINVFEHVLRPNLEAIAAAMRTWLKPGGLALVRAGIWTGLAGGHLLEWTLQNWYDPAVPRRSEPWEHLRKRRFEANTTLNELHREDYRNIFREHFEILEEIDPPRTGQDQFLTPEIRAELADYSEQDLLDDHPLFVLRPLAGGEAASAAFPRASSPRRRA